MQLRRIENVGQFRVPWNNVSRLEVDREEHSMLTVAGEPRNNSILEIVVKIVDITETKLAAKERVGFRSNLQDL